MTLAMSISYSWESATLYGKRDSAVVILLRIWRWEAYPGYPGLCAAAAAAKSLQLCPTLCDPIDSQLTRLRRPWDSPGKNTGVGCHFLLQCMKVKSESEVAQLCTTLCDPVDCSLPGSSIHGIFQARVLQWIAIAFSVGYVGRP